MDGAERKAQPEVVTDNREAAAAKPCGFYECIVRVRRIDLEDDLGEPGRHARHPVKLSCGGELSGPTCRPSWFGGQNCASPSRGSVRKWLRARGDSNP